MNTTDNNEVIKLSGRMKEITINSQDRIKRDCAFLNSSQGVEMQDLLSQYYKGEITTLELFYAIRRIPMKGVYIK